MLDSRWDFGKLIEKVKKFRIIFEQLKLGGTAYRPEGTQAINYSTRGNVRIVILKHYFSNG